MPKLVQIEARDRQLLASVDASLNLAVKLGSQWIACRPGCTQCCIGPFAITALDALRLQAGLRRLQADQPERAAHVLNRSRHYVQTISSVYPGDSETGEIRDEEALPESMDEIPCPALDPQTGLCELYDSRPLTCRTFGPATQIGTNTFAACELCYVGATDSEMAACSVEIDPEGIESELLEELNNQGPIAKTIVAYALTRNAAG